MGLIVGRILGGISTNLLFSAFESWMTTEHHKRGFPEAWLSTTFSAASIGNGTMAVCAGILAQLLEDSLGHIGPFQGAIVLTIIALIMILEWDENYGDRKEGDEFFTSLRHQFVDGWSMTFSDSRILRMGFVQALSEGGMYTFVFMWVPTLISQNPPGGVPTGCVFSSLMMAITIGGIIFPYLQPFFTRIASKSNATELSAVIVYVFASISMALPSACLLFNSGSCLTLLLWSFIHVEICVGLFLPLAGTLRSKYVPDSHHAAILNIFRLPLNFVVVLGTYATDFLDPSYVFLLISCCFMIAAILQASLLTKTGGIASGKKRK